MPERGECRGSVTGLQVLLSQSEPNGQHLKEQEVEE
jgi:hypothetical protein